MNDFPNLGVDEVRAIVEQQLNERASQGPRTAGPAPLDHSGPGFAAPSQDTPSTTDEGGAIPWEALRALPTTGLKEPPKYSGHRESDAAKVWLIQVERWIEAREVLGRRVLTDKEKIALITSYLERQAAAWWNLTFQASKDDPNEYPPYEHWSTWKDAFTTQFGDVRTQEQRRDEFDLLRQITTVQAFRQAIDSRRLYLTPRPTDADCLLLFKRGLKPHIRNRIEIVPDRMLPDNYLDYVAFADKSEREYLASKNRVRFFTNRPQPRTVRTSTLDPPSANIGRTYGKPKLDRDGDVEMAFNNLRLSSNSPRGNARGMGRPYRGRAGRRPPYSGSRGSTTTAMDGRSPEGTDRARREDLCFQCHRSGHYARECPTGIRRGGPTRRGGRGKGGRR